MITQVVRKLQAKARAGRAEVFRRHFHLTSSTTILDIGSEDGSNVAGLLAGTAVRPDSVYIADLNESAVNRGRDKYGFCPVVIPESGRLPFGDQYFDIVYCSSVIEHVTVPKSVVWTLRDEKLFRSQAWDRQREFALELRRLGKQYFVQTPCKSFPIESHSWLPFLGYAPRRVLIAILKVSNRFWPKQTAPDWNLLSPSQVGELFPDATIVFERFAGIRKSIMAIKR